MFDRAKEVFSRELSKFNCGERAEILPTCHELLKLPLPTEIVSVIIFEQLFPKSIEELIVERQDTKVIHDAMRAFDEDNWGNIMAETINYLFMSRESDESFNNILWYIINNVSDEFLGLKFECRNYCPLLHMFFEQIIDDPFYQIDNQTMTVLANIIHKVDEDLLEDWYFQFSIWYDDIHHFYHFKNWETKRSMDLDEDDEFIVSRMREIMNIFHSEIDWFILKGSGDTMDRDQDLELRRWNRLTNPETQFTWTRYVKTQRTTRTVGTVRAEVCQFPGHSFQFADGDI